MQNSGVAVQIAYVLP